MKHTERNLRARIFRVAGVGIATCGLALAATGTSVASPWVSIQPDAPRPVPEQAQCDDGGTLWLYNGPALSSTNTVINTGINVAAGTLYIDRFWSWDGYEGRSADTELDERFAVRVGSTVGPFTPDLPDGVVQAAATGWLGHWNVPAGQMQIVHSSVGSETAGPNTVYVVGLCWRATVVSDTTVPTSVSTSVVTTVDSTVVTSVGDTTIATTVPESTVATTKVEVTTTKAPATTQNLFVSTAPPTNPNPTLTPAPTVAPSTAAATVAPTTIAATTIAPTTIAPTTIAPTTAAVTTVAPVAQVEGAVIEAAEAEDLSYTGSSNGMLVGVGLAMVAAGLAVCLSARRRQA
jgi:hypothetical protein